MRSQHPRAFTAQGTVIEIFGASSDYILPRCIHFEYLYLIPPFMQMLRHKIFQLQMKSRKSTPWHLKWCLGDPWWLSNEPLGTYISWIPLQVSNASFINTFEIVDWEIPVVLLKRDVLTHCGTWRQMATSNLVNTGAGNVLLREGTKPWPNPVVACNPWIPVAVVWGYFQ